MKNDFGENERIVKYIPLVEHVVKRFKRAWDFKEHVWDDLYGEAYWALVRADHDFSSSYNTKFITHAHTYISTAIRNEIKSITRWIRNPKGLDYGWENPDEKRSNFINQDAASPYYNAERREIQEILVRAFRVLNGNDKNIILNHYLEGKTDSEIKNDLRLSIGRGGVAFRRQGVLKKLKKALWQDYVKSDLL
jgi:RNA polymerase sigma factor (sigma-70 family)